MLEHWFFKIEIFQGGLSGSKIENRVFYTFTIISKIYYLNDFNKVRIENKVW